MTDRADQLLAKAALDKTREGRTPTAREANALKRVQREAEEQARWDHYRTVPPKHYKEMSGRSAGTLIAQQKTWGLPCASKTIDLEKVVRWIHDFLGENAQKLLAGDPESPGSKALERYRTLAADEKEMQLRVARGELIPIVEAEEVGGALAARLVQCVSVLETSFATEVELWLADEGFRAQPAEQRKQTVRAFVARTCAAVRRQEAGGIRALLAGARRERAEGGGNGGNGAAPVAADKGASAK